MIADILGRTNNCYTGADCWDYDYSDRWLLLLGITISIVVIYRIGKHIAKNKAGKQEI
jgi:hypothetical protein